MRHSVPRWRVTVLACAVVLVGTVAMSGDQIKQPWRAAFDPEGVSAEPAAPFEATEAILLLESFTDVTFPPAGWTEAIINDPGTDPDWSRVTTGTSPTIAPHTAPAMARFNSLSCPDTASARLSTPMIDFSTVVAPSLTFWMSHDAGDSANPLDKISIEVSTDGGGTWAVDVATFYRYDAACTTACWQEHTVDLSAYVGPNSVSIGFLGVSDLGYQMYIDDVMVAEPAPNLSTSTKTAPAFVLEDAEIAYTVSIVNTGNAPANAATMVDVLPPDTTYVAASVTCTSGVCSYNAGLNQIEWAGTLALAETVTVSFAVDTAAVACGAALTNTAVIDDPELIFDPVSVSATTRVVSIIAGVDESFADTTFPPLGWTEEIVVDPGTDPDWSRVTTGTSPTIAPHTAPAMAKFNSFNTQATGSARLSTPSMSLAGLTMPRLSFWMSHDTGYTTNTDLVQSQVSTDAGVTWVDVGDPVMRYNADCSPACWMEHLVDLGAYVGLPDVRIGLLGVSDYGNNIYVDDVSVAEPWYPCPSVSIEPDFIGGGCGGDVLTYELTVTNIFSAPDTLNVTYSNLWPMTVEPTSFTLGVGESAVSTVSVPVPWSSAPGDYDIASFLVTGQISGLTDTATIRSFVNVAGTYTDYADVPADDGHRVRDHSVVHYAGKLYKIGGYGGTTGAARAFVDVYDIATDTWSAADPLPGARYYIDCVEIGAKIYCAGGYLTSGQSTLYIFDPAAPAGTQWTTGAPMPANRYAYGGVALNGKYYVLGGYTTTYTPTCLVYDPLTDSWASIADMEVGRRYPLAGAIGGKIYVTGGLVSSSTSTPSTQAYDPATDTWSSLAPNPYGGWVRTADGVVDDRFLLITGGYSNDATASNYVIAYDALSDMWDVPQATMPHLIYGAEGDTDGEGNFWFASGRLYEDGAFSYSNYTEKVTGCPPPTADLSVLKDDGVTQVLPGDPVTYTITASNLGPAPVAGAQVVDIFPADLLDVNWTCAGTGGATCTAAGVGNINDLADIPSGESVVYTATGTVDPNAEGTLIEGRLSLVNTATVYPPGSTGDPDLGNNSSTDIDDIVRLADVAITKDDGVTEVVPGDPVTYTITVINLGPGDTVGALVTDAFPEDILGVTWTCVGSGGGVCTPAGVGNLVDVAGLPNGGSVVYTATGMVSPDATGTIDNIANVVVTDVTDPDPGNNSATDSDTVGAPPLPFADGFESGDTSAWSLTVP